MNWPSSKANRVLAALLRIGWSVKRHAGSSHRIHIRKIMGENFMRVFAEAERVAKELQTAR